MIFQMKVMEMVQFLVTEHKTQKEFKGECEHGGEGSSVPETQLTSQISVPEIQLAIQGDRKLTVVAETQIRHPQVIT